MLLGIDVGIVNNGVAVYDYKQQLFVYQNTIKATHEHVADKLVFINKQLNTIIDDYQITDCCYEHPVMRSGKNVQDVNCALGVIFLVLRLAGIPFKGLSPNRIKRDITTNAKADKREVMTALRQHNVVVASNITKFDSHHAADAIACILSFLEKGRK